MFLPEICIVEMAITVNKKTSNVPLARWSCFVMGLLIQTITITIIITLPNQPPSDCPIRRGFVRLAAHLRN